MIYKFTPTQGDGTVNYFDLPYTWEDAHSASDGSGTSLISPDCEICSANIFGMFLIQRGFLPFDTSSIPNNETIISATVRLWCSLNDTESDPDCSYIALVQSNQNSASTLEISDYSKCGDVTGPTYTGKKNQSDIVVNNYVTLTIASNYFTWINKEGVTKLGLRLGFDIENEAPAGINNFTFSTSRETTTPAHKPLLTIETTTPESPYPQSWLEKNKISGYNCFMSQYLKAKTKGYKPLKLPDGTIF